MWLIASAMHILLVPLFGITSINLFVSVFWGVDMQSQYHSSQIRSDKSYSDAIFHCDWWRIEALCVWIVNMTILNNHTFGRKRAADCTFFWLLLAVLFVTSIHELADQNFNFDLHNLRKNLGLAKRIHFMWPRFCENKDLETEMN
jgi:hypothetical protein